MAIEDFDQVTIEAAKLRPFSKFIMSIGELPTSYLDSLSYAEQVTWFCDYLQNHVIPALNNNADALVEVQNLMTQLQDYVNNYFDNLDVQEEINQKLDEMTENGTLTNLIKNYVDPIYQAYETDINNQISVINSKVNAAYSGSPLVASSTAEMTETDRVYVNTTDGKWYYYDGDSWEIGGTYQTTGIGENTINYDDFNAKTKLILNKITIPTFTTDTGFVSKAGNMTASNDYFHTSNIQLKQNQTIIANMKGTNDSGGNPRVAVISIVDDTSYEPVVLNDGTDESDYTYTATRDCYVVLSSYKNITITPVIYNDSNVIREKINNLNKNIPYTLSETSKVLSYLSGNISDHNSYDTSNYIKILDNGTLIFKTFNNMVSTLSNGGVCFYDKTKTFISGVQLPIDRILTLSIPAGAEYFRFCIQKTNTLTELYYSDIINSSSNTILNLREEINNKICFDFSMFNKVGVVGDSYANGVFNNENHPDFSWPSMLGKKYGCDVANFSRGGLSTRTWITSTTYGLPQLLSSPKQDIYLLVLERNDYGIEYGGETGYLGSITDITSHSLGSYPDTFYGNYATIIESILNYATDCKLIMISGDFKNSLGISFNEAMEDIAEHYNIPIIKELDDIYFNSDLYTENWPTGGHPGVIQYNGMLNAIARLFDNCVKENMSYFSDIGIEQ